MLSANPNVVFFRRFALVPFVILMVIIITMLILHQLFVVQTNHQKTLILQQEQNVQRLQRQVQSLQMQRSMSLQYQTDFYAIKGASLLAALDRVQWADHLNEWSRNWLASSLTIQFAAEQLLNPSDMKHFEITQPIFYSSRIQVGLMLQVDTDYNYFIQMLRRQFGLPIILERCNLSLQSTGVDKEIVLNVEQGNINLQCSFLSLRAQPRSFSPEVLP